MSAKNEGKIGGNTLECVYLSVDGGIHVNLKQLFNFNIINRQSRYFK